MEIKGRLKLIADKVPNCRVLCDVGTDHAYIPVCLVKNRRCGRAVACDIGVGPLNAAKQNIKLFGLEAFIEARLGYGLDAVFPGEADAIVIAGMGGTLINNILEKGFETAKRASWLILQPMNAAELVRKWLYGRGFEIYDEELAAEGSKLYGVICSRWTGKERELDEIYYYIGEKLISKRDPLLEKYIERKRSQLENALKELQAAGDKGVEIRQKFDERIRELDKILNIIS
ncbi:tRNA (adenine22-N1)-methyltransferase [Anaerobacterium chartisolvens]|uniref:tRNA (Adenine22-N1)-methyltransferase n=1 Tax=Anaerobacterium chartisolvens TaxID=1297424 RepID=A0A369AXC6_9FIRM|nr:class I SAM-dependent methyltransferase [Anaerobacterium chartisolvens]RCX13813.1 tRNA (adenine22-N1)-methyltransferase [Anaerobacterium chartisolvens]